MSALYVVRPYTKYIHIYHTEQLCKVSNSLVPILQIKKQRHREVNNVRRGKADFEPRLDSRPTLFTVQPVYVTDTHVCF